MVCKVTYFVLCWVTGTWGLLSHTYIHVQSGVKWLVLSIGLFISLFSEKFWNLYIYKLDNNIKNKYVRDQTSSIISSSFLSRIGLRLGMCGYLAFVLSELSCKTPHPAPSILYTYATHMEPPSENPNYGPVYEDLLLHEEMSIEVLKKCQVIWSSMCLTFKGG